ncbi:NAD(P)/FAD-dependent oxidoreductase [Pseudahrensia aquimaris]|uniref:NAD(P)/FAD-dependent oxidoreductase n=1 Tax=Pseudahrensia aquimaris TaxID=744461 RepID=A0ABW3FE46_9HYPH
MSDAYQSPVSPGVSWYEATVGDRPTYPTLDGDKTCDVVIVGGGFCGLSAAYHLAKAGSSVVLLEQHRLGDGASGRNGGQMGTGQRASVLEMEQAFGFERAKALFDMAEDAKTNLFETAKAGNFEFDYQPGQLTPMHKKRYEAEAREEVEALNGRFGYGAVDWLDQREMAQALGSDHYVGGGLRDVGTGHIHPMKYLVGLGKTAAQTGAEIFETTRALAFNSVQGKIEVRTASGTVRAERCLMALNGHHNDVHPALSSKIMPIQSFIGTTAPLGHNSPVLPGGEAADDSRFVVRYFRKTIDNRLLFGGREAYGKATPGDIRRTINKQIAEIYPMLDGVELTHAWGGNVAITMPRQPYVRELEPGLWAAGGFSGHGVMLSNYTGRMIAENWLGKSEQIDLLRELKIPSFPGGKWLRNPLKVLALTWYAMVDRV